MLLAFLGEIGRTALNIEG